MREDHRRGIHFDGFSYNFSRMHLHMAQRAGKKSAMFQHLVLVIEEDDHKDFSLLVCQLTL